MGVLKRVMAVLLATTVLLTGCTKEEVELLELSKEYAKLDGASYNGNFQMNFDIPENSNAYHYLSPTIGYGDDNVRSKYFDKFSTISVDYIVEYVKSKGVAQGTFTDSKTGDVMFAFVLKDKTLYADVGYILNMYNELLSADYENADTIGDAVKRETLAKSFDGVRYVSVSKSDLQAMFAENNSEYISGNESEYSDEYERFSLLIEDLFSLNYFEKSGVAQAAFIDKILLGAFKDFEGDIVSFEDGAYVIRMDAPKLLMLIEKLLLYMVDRTDEIATAFNEVIDETPINAIAYDYSWYDSEEQYKDDIKDGISKLAAQVNENKEEYKENIKTYLNAENVGIVAIMSFLEGTSAETRIKPVAGGVEDSNNLSLRFKTGLFDPNAVKIELFKGGNVKPVTDITQTLPPKELTKSITALSKEMDTPKAMLIRDGYAKFYSYIDETDDYDDENSENEGTDQVNKKDFKDMSVTLYSGLSYDYSYINCIETENGLYVKSDFVGEFFNENITHNEGSYIINNGEVTKVRGMTDGADGYINVNDLVELGYTVNFDFESNATIIIKR